MNEFKKVSFMNLSTAIFLGSSIMVLEVREIVPRLSHAMIYS